MDARARKEKRAGKAPKLNIQKETEVQDHDTGTALPTTSRTRRSSVAMTKYEHAKIIGMRAEQIARGAQPFVNDDVDLNGRFDPIAVATREMNAGVLPFVVVRKLPDGTHEKWRLRDFIMPF